MTSVVVLNQIAALERLVAEQAKRIAAIEARLAADTRAPRSCNGGRIARSAQLRDAIAAILAARGHEREMTAKHVRVALERQSYAPMPALRTLRWHLARIRGNGNTAHCHRSD